MTATRREAAIADAEDSRAGPPAGADGTRGGLPPTASRSGGATARKRSLVIASTLVARLASPDAAAVFRAFVDGHPVGEGGGTPADLARAAGLEGGGGDVEARLEEASETFALVFGFRLIERRRPRFVADGAKTDADRRGAPSVRPDKRLVELLAQPFPRIAASTGVPVLDPASSTWASVVTSTALARARLNFVLRGDGDRSARYFALSIAGGLAGGRMPVSMAHGGNLAAIVLRAECHAGARGGIVVVAPSLLVHAAASSEAAWFEDPVAPHGEGEDLNPTADLASLGSVRTALRCTYVWSVPARGGLPRAMDGIVAGCIGPLGYDAAWAHGVVEHLFPGLSSAARGSILSRLADPRDAGPMTAAARASAGSGVMALEAAAAFVSRSSGTRPGAVVGPSAPAVAFDPRLIVADVDVSLLLDRATHLRANGVRLILVGPVGGGKSSLATALVHAMATADGGLRPIFLMSPQLVLAPAWGATERSLAGIWNCASCEGGIVMVDELDALCGAREVGVTSGNASLVRSLTDSFIRNLDEHRGVPFVAAVNHVESVDAALARRCAFVIHVAADLTPERERLAWTSMLGIDPPRSWEPVGASVSDFSMAAARCAMMGETDADEIAAAIVRARAVRRGPLASVRARGSVH